MTLMPIVVEQKLIMYCLWRIRGTRWFWLHGVITEMPDYPGYYQCRIYYGAYYQHQADVYYDGDDWQEGPSAWNARP